jgi:hypothetical protein
MSPGKAQRARRNGEQFTGDFQAAEIFLAGRSRIILWPLGPDRARSASNLTPIGCEEEEST